MGSWQPCYWQSVVGWFGTGHWTGVGAGQATGVLQSPIRPAGCAVSMAGLRFSLLQVNESWKWIWNYSFKVVTCHAERDISASTYLWVCRNMRICFFSVYMCVSVQLHIDIYIVFFNWCIYSSFGLVRVDLLLNNDHCSVIWKKAVTTALLKRRSRQRQCPLLVRSFSLISGQWWH